MALAGVRSLVGQTPSALGCGRGTPFCGLVSAADTEKRNAGDGATAARALVVLHGRSQVPSAFSEMRVTVRSARRGRLRVGSL